MKVLRNKLVIYFLIFGVLISFAFGCALAAGHFVMKNMHHSAHSECCDNDYFTSSFNNASHNLTVALSQNNSSGLLLVLSLLFLSVLFFIFSYFNLKIKCYYLSIRDKYGGSGGFDYFIELFKKGVLHPKLF